LSKISIKYLVFGISLLFVILGDKNKKTNVFVKNTDLGDSTGLFFKTHEIAILLNNNDSVPSITEKINQLLIIIDHNK